MARLARRARPRRAVRLAAVPPVPAAVSVPTTVLQWCPPCRYCGVPLCNLSGDALLVAADVAFARALYAGNHLLWAEDTALPDIVPAKQRLDDGMDTVAENVVLNHPCVLPSLRRPCGFVAGATHTHAPTKVLCVLLRMAPAGEMAASECRGCHRGICVELKVHFLLLNAILQAPQLAEAEGADFEQARGGRTMAILRTLLSRWASDASARCAAPVPCKLVPVMSTFTLVHVLHDRCGVFAGVCRWRSTY